MTMTAEQKMAHKTRYGSSEIAVLLGLTPPSWKQSALDVWLRKTSEVELEDDGETVPQRRGRILEPAVAQFYAEDFSATLRSPGTLIHPDVDFACATPDRIATLPTGEERGVEVKTSAFFTDEWGEPGSDSVPKYYRVQCVWELLHLHALMGISKLDVALWAGMNDEVRYYHLERDAALETDILDFVGAWHKKHVLGQTPPKVDGSPSWGEYFDKKPSSGKTIEVADSSHPLYEKAHVYHQWSEKLKELTEWKAQAWNELKEQMVAYDTCKLPFGTLHYKQDKDGVDVDWEAAFELLKGKVSEEDWKKALAEKSTVRRGARTLRPFWKKPKT